MARQRVLLTGAKGNLGQAFHKVLLTLPDIDCIAATRETLDLASDEASLLTALETYAPDIIINTAAYTNVDKAESERALAAQVNANAPATMAKWVAEHQSYLVHISTDYVFDGSQNTPYKPSDTPNPIGYYGQSKLDGEIAIQNIAKDQSAILRVAWLYGDKPMGFVHFLLSAITARRNGEERTVQAVCDQTGTPTWTESVAALLPSLLQNRPTGLFHATNQGAVSRLEQARFIFDALGEPTDAIHSAQTSDFFQDAKRPPYTIMESSFPEMTSWESATLAFLAQQPLSHPVSQKALNV